MGNNPAVNEKCGDNCPVENIFWDDVQQFIQKLNQMGEGFYRLPTEAEWEYTERAGTNTPFAFGNCLGTDDANYSGNLPLTGCPEVNYLNDDTISVATLSKNDWGLYDMHGNVWEWCNDWYGEYPSQSVTNPKGTSTGDVHVFRGAWHDDARGCRSAVREYLWIKGRDSHPCIGFRLLRELKP